MTSYFFKKCTLSLCTVNSIPKIPKIKKLNNNFFILLVLQNDFFSDHGNVFTLFRIENIYLFNIHFQSQYVTYNKRK